MVGDDRVPDPLAGARVEGDEAGIGRGHEELVLVNGEVAAHAGVAGRRHLHLVLPDEVSGGRVERLHHRADAGEVHDAVVHDRRRRVPAALAHRPHPGQLQLAGVEPVDVRQRAVVPRLVIAPDHQPVAVVRIAQHRVGDGPIVLDRAGHGDAARLGRGGRRRRRRPRYRRATASRLRTRGRAAARRAAVRLRDGRGRRVDGGADGNGRGLGQRRNACRGAVRLQQIGHDVQVRLVGEGTRLPRRHRAADADEQIARTQIPPELQEALAGELRRLEGALQVGLVADGALALVDRAAGFRLGGRVDAVSRRLCGGRNRRVRHQNHRRRRRQRPSSESVS